MKQPVLLSIIILTLMVSCWVSAGWSEDAAQTRRPVVITAAGSGVNIGITRLLAKALMKQNQHVKIDIPGSIGTRGAITAVADGAIALGLISRPLKNQEKAIGIVAHPYARVAIVIAAHSDVKDDTITSQELVEIFRGTKTHWQDGETIIVQAREKSDSGFLVLQNIIPEFKTVYIESSQAKRWTLYFNDQDANNAISNTPHAIGVTDLGMIKTEHLNAKALKLDGIDPNQENVISGRYPLSRQLSFIYRPGTLSDEAKLFLNFITTETGRDILQTNGYIPLL
ncbi:PstS4 [Desulforapulum autotrophicum HRM2]|uniref:PstS4 n=1 Tax=Desulforapulum autotrophicum (strain ATCC 43914 / DSM 3382 / VKM B-1955 / HRM2) TaxID=177437 RepID=C0QA96_DESAH|nr:substrate-binding domain-containing protein [Desulforapulum autotrophicum]ACN14681.1 PstS4 [Desulforapulum autotrophicum HRM2]